MVDSKPALHGASLVVIAGTNFSAIHRAWCEAAEIRAKWVIGAHCRG
jgi:hypothetical protein